jgi:membrane fusion protein (multidrug efflux system)
MTDTVPQGQVRSVETPGSRRLPLVLLVILALIGVGAALWFAWVGRYRVETDDAYVNGNLMRITPQTAGTVVAIQTDETQYVRKGQLLARLDDTDAQVALTQAKANLAATVRDVARMFADEQRDEATVRAQQARLDQATQDYARDRSLLPVHGVSAETLQHDQDALRSARAALDQARAALAATRATIAGTTPATHPRVLQAQAQLRTAWLTAARTRVLAPASGFVVRRAVQLGQQVTPATELLALVPLDSVWIDANFKETQLADLRIGQPVRVIADLYGSRVPFHGKVLGLTAGTGSALAVLPAQNASGNWIKVVQRLPVRIGLDPAELAQHPLFLGLSTKVAVDVHDRSGPMLSQQAAWHANQQTDVYAVQDVGVEAAIREIVAANLPHQPPAPAHDAAGAP